MRTSGPSITVAVFTTGRLGVDLAERILARPEVGAVHLVTTDLPGRDRGTIERARLTWQRDGPPGLAKAQAGRLLAPFRPGRPETLARYAADRCPRAGYHHCPDLHAPAALALVRALAPDLGVVFGCYRLRGELFGIPRLGTLNLHLGRAPEFRGSSPGFYEMLAGEAEVGVTVHRVDDGLDSGWGQVDVYAHIGRCGVAGEVCGDDHKIMPAFIQAGDGGVHFVGIEGLVGHLGTVDVEVEPVQA
jgi:hypothetical protein